MMWPDIQASYLVALLMIILDIFGAGCALADTRVRRGRLSTGRRVLHGRRGNMDDSIPIIDPVDKRVPADNRTPDRQRVAALALASLEGVVAVFGEEEPLVATTQKPVETEPPRRPLPPCRNGGIRLLGSFCYCSPKFMGRYCEIYRYNSSCGRVPHGEWVYLNCNSCFCIAGVLECQPHTLKGCETMGQIKTPPPTTPETESDFIQSVTESGNSAISWLSHSNALLHVLSLILSLRHLLHRGPHR